MASSCAVQRLLKLCVAIVALGCGTGQAGAAEDVTPTQSAVPTFRFDVALQPLKHTASVTVTLDDAKQQIRWLAFAMDPRRISAVTASGELRRQGTTALWHPSQRQAQLSYKVDINHLRTSRSRANSKHYDALCTDRWAILRGDDLIPPAKMRIRKGIEPISTLRFTLPAGWHAALPYAKEPDGTYRIVNPHRKFDRPSGWLALGRLKIVRERIGNTYVTIASPVGDHFHSLDVLALLRWTQPSYEKTFGQSPERLLIVGANDPMWRGGLSGPASVYLHGSLPLIGHDATSPLLHELTHTFLSARSGLGGDWINEGLAELYSLELLKRSGTISEHRYKKALTQLGRQGERIKTLDTDSAHGALTARAAVVLHKLDRHLRRKSADRIGLDDVVHAMAAAPTAWTTLKFREICENVAHLQLKRFFDKYVTAPHAHRSP